jgi:transcriptional regulator with XRE-family HTH domain
VSYAEDVGSRLRRVRMQQGLSLQDVERRSDGLWKAAVVGSYERGDRNISASRLIELAEFYGVAPSEILPADDSPRPLDRGPGIVVDLERLAALGSDFDGVRRYCESIQLQRGDYNRELLSVRGDDLRALAVIMATEPEQLLEILDGAGVLRRVS